MDKHSSDDCLAYAIEMIRNDPTIVRSKINTFTDIENDQLNNILWPGVFDNANWYRESTRRPSVKDLDPDGDQYMIGTDVVIRVFTNDLWDEYGRVFNITVREEQGELSAEFDIQW